jgi:hypothetical protein
VIVGPSLADLEDDVVRVSAMVRIVLLAFAALVIGCGVDEDGASCAPLPATELAPGDLRASWTDSSFVVLRSNGSDGSAMAVAGGELAFRSEVTGCRGTLDDPCLEDMVRLEIALPEFHVGEVGVAGFTIRFGSVRGIEDIGTGIFLGQTSGSARAVIDGACLDAAVTWESVAIRPSWDAKMAQAHAKFTAAFDVPRRLKATGVVDGFRLAFDGDLLATTDEWETLP